MKFHLVALQANLSYCCLDLTTTKIPTLALPFCRKTTMLQRDKNFSVQGYTCILEQNRGQGNFDKMNHPGEVGAEGTSYTHPLQLEAHREKPCCKHPACLVTASNSSAKLMQLDCYGQQKEE